MDACQRPEELDELFHFCINEKYLEPVRDLGSINGGDGNVWFADLSISPTPRRVAIKELHPAGAHDERHVLFTRLARQLKLWSKFRHPNVITLIGFSLYDDMTRALLISPYMANGNISEYFKRVDPSPITRLKLALDTAEGLKYLHELDPALCHGDLKSHNVLVTGDIRAVLCDFGLANTVQEDSDLMASNRLHGTLRYMSWELAGEDSKHTLPSDMWAWGCLFIEITFDLVPYKEAQTDRGVMALMVQNKKPADLQELDVSERLRSLVESCWDEDPSERPTAATCCDVLRAELCDRNTDPLQDFGPITTSAQDDFAFATESPTGTPKAVLSSSAPSYHGEDPHAGADSLLGTAGTGTLQWQERLDEPHPNSLSDHDSVSHEQLAKANEIVNRICSARRNNPANPTRLELSGEEKDDIARSRLQWQALAVQAAQSLDNFFPLTPAEVKNRDITAEMCAKLLDESAVLNSEEQSNDCVSTPHVGGLLRDFIHRTRDWHESAQVMPGSYPE